jgi:hypothetical protein
MSSSNPSASKQNVAEFVKAFAPYNPLCRFQSASGEAFPAPRGVAKRDGVGSRIKTNFVGAGMRAGAAGARIDIARVTCGFHAIHQLDQRAGRRVFLGCSVQAVVPITIGM